MTDQEIKDIYQRAIGNPIPEWGMDMVKKIAEEAIRSQGSAVNLVLAERKRQIEVERFTPDMDDTYTDCELAGAAACYIFGSKDLDYYGAQVWPWNSGWFKPEGGYLRALSKGVALGLAEIERVQRAEDRKNLAEAELCPS